MDATHPAEDILLKSFSVFPLRGSLALMPKNAPGGGKGRSTNRIYLETTYPDMTLSRSFWLSEPSILNTAVRSRRRYSLLISRPCRDLSFHDTFFGEGVPRNGGRGAVNRYKKA